MPRYIARRYNGKEDLEKMQDLVARTMDIYSHLHPGDIAWQRFQHPGSDEEWQTYMIEDGNELVAFAWLEPPEDLWLCVNPANPEATDEIIDIFASGRSGNTLSIEIMETEEHIISELPGKGFRELKEGPFYARMYLDLANLPEAELPEGFSARHMDIDRDFERRVDLHRKVWNPSKVTYESYRNVTRTPPYTPRLDWVIESPEGDFASYCLLWPDRESGIGLFEPVGTSPEFRRMGLSRAVCISAMREYRKMGGTGVEVNSRGDSGRPAPAKLYQSIGFRAIARTRKFVRQC